MEEQLLAMISPVASGRASWGRAPQGTAFPYLVLNLISAPREYTSSGQDKLVVARVQVDIYAETYATLAATARHFARAVTARRSGSIESIQIDQERDLPASFVNDVNHLLRRNFDLMVAFRET